MKGTEVWIKAASPSHFASSFCPFECPRVTPPMTNRSRVDGTSPLFFLQLCCLQVYKNTKPSSSCASRYLPQPSQVRTTKWEFFLPLSETVFMGHFKVVVYASIGTSRAWFIQPLSTHTHKHLKHNPRLACYLPGLDNGTPWPYLEMPLSCEREFSPLDWHLIH